MGTEERNTSETTLKLHYDAILILYYSINMLCHGHTKVVGLLLSFLERRYLKFISRGNYHIQTAFFYDGVIVSKKTCAMKQEEGVGSS